MHAIVLPLPHPLVHVSRSHFVLDVPAVAILWHLLPLVAPEKIGSALICGAAGPTLAAMCSPLIREIGLGGLVAGVFFGFRTPAPQAKHKNVVKKDGTR